MLEGFLIVAAAIGLVPFTGLIFKFLYELASLVVKGSKKSRIC